MARVFSEPGKQFSNSQLDREFRNVQQGINNLLSGDVLVTGQWTFTLGESDERPPDANTNWTPITVTGDFDADAFPSHFLPILRTEMTGTSIPLQPADLIQLTTADTGGYGWRLGAINTAMSLEALGQLSFKVPIQFTEAPDGILFFQQSAMQGPDAITRALIRYDYYLRSDFTTPPPLVNTTRVAVTTIHPDQQDGGSDRQFAFQWAWATNEDYDASTNPMADPRLRIRAGAPTAATWDGDWGAVPVVYDLETVTADPAWQGALLMNDRDVSYPDGGRVVPFKQQAAALYIDYTDTIKPGPFLPGATIAFNGGFGYSTPDAAFSLALGTLTIPAGNPGAYSLNAMFTLDIGTGATAILGVHDNGVAVPGLASAASTGNQNTVVTLAISGIFPVDDTAHTIDIRVMPSSNTVLVVESGQFWIKREFS